MTMLFYFVFANLSAPNVGISRRERTARSGRLHAVLGAFI